MVGHIDTLGRQTKPRRVCRRLQLLRGWSNDEQADEQIFARGARARGADVFEHREEHPTEWAAMVSIATKIGCVGETLRSWVRRAKRDSNARAGPAM